MGYEDSPATQMLATFCACCSLELVDAESIETGVGPVCRKKHGYGNASARPDWNAVAAALGQADYLASVQSLRGEDRDDELKAARRIANVLVHGIAVEQHGARVKARTLAIAALGYVKLAARIADRLGAVTVEEENGSYVVRAPFSDAFNQAARQVPGAWFDRARRARIVPMASKPSLWKAIRACFPGVIVIGPRGMVVA